MTHKMLCTALFLITITGTLLHAQTLARPIRPAGVPDNYVITPFGYFHPSCVLHVAEGETLLAKGRVLQRADGSLENLQECQFPHYAVSGEIVAGATKVESPTINGWVESEGVTTSTSYGEIVADWVVPPAPTSNASQIVYFFPGLMDKNDEVSIIQPVLQFGYNGDFGGNYWVIASWNCCPSNTADYSTPVDVNPGDTIQGTVKSTCSAGTESCSTWNITTADTATGGSTTLSNSPSEGQTFNWAVGAVLEAYNITQCSNYPPNGGIFFYNVALYDYNFNHISSPAWSATDWASGETPQCSYSQNVDSSTELELEYGTPAIGGVSPPSLTTQVGSGYVVLYGTGLDNSNGTTSTTISGSGMTWTTSYVSASQINVYYTLASNAPLGTRTITVTTSAGSATAPLVITNSAAPPPAINSGGIVPSSITQGSSGTVSIYGEDLQNNAGQTTTTISGTGVTWTPTYISPTLIDVNYTVASNAPTGTRTVTVTTTSGSSTAPITVAP